MLGKISPRTQAFLLILRWTIAGIFFANGWQKLSDPSFGANAPEFFHSLTDDIIVPPYKAFFKDIVLDNIFIAASIVKYSELALAAIFFIGFPLRIGAIYATALHLNYLCIASFPTFIYLNAIMIVAEWTVMSAFTKET